MTTRRSLGAVLRATLVATAGMTALTGCFATQADIRVLQSDLGLIRSEQASADSARKTQLDGVIRTMRGVNDSMAALTSRMTRFRTDMSGSMSSVEQQLLAIQELTGQSQRKLQEMRAAFEAREAAAAQVPAEAPPVATTKGGKAAKGKSAKTPPKPPVETPAEEPAAEEPPPPAEPSPGPNQLFQLGREQLMQGSNSAARSAFEDLIKKYPKSDVAPDAQFYIAETYAAEGNADAADSVYARVAAKYAGSPRAATAIYKRAVASATAGEPATAKKLFNELIKKYPRSDEAALARDRVKALD